MEGNLKITTGGVWGDDEVTYEHPSYGMISFNRVTNSGQQVLFGSPINRHYSSVRLRIHQGRRRHHLKHDRFSAAEMAPFVDVEMSAAQFAEAITNMNAGDGVPCTIRSVNGRMVEDPPLTPLEVEKIRQSFAEDMKDLGNMLARSIERADELLKKKSLTKQDKEEIIAELRLASSHFASNKKFAVDSFQEATEKIVTSAKVEIEATFQTMIRNAGINALTEGMEPPQLLLTEHPDNTGSGEPETK